jgi:glycosyltransferase involved in cell wall biosynthesis
MNIFMVNTLYHPHELGGAERVVKSLAEALVSEGHQVSVATLRPGQGLRTEKLNGVTVHYFGVPGVLWPYYQEANPRHLKLVWKALDSLRKGMAHGLDRLLDREKPDLVHSHNLPGFSVAVWHAAKARRLPLVHNLHDYSLLCARTSMFRSGRNCSRQCAVCRVLSYSKRGPSNSVDAVVGVSRFVLERHTQHGFFARSRSREVIFNSYENPCQPPSHAHEPSRPLRLGYLGRLHPGKGIGWLLEALDSLPSKQWEILLAGSGEARYAAELRRRFASPRVHFLGFVRPEEFFSRIDVLLVPSLLQEPFGRIIIEAYAHGVPVIAADRGGIPEIVDDGRTGYLFRPDSVESLWGAIRKYVEDPSLAARTRLAALGKARDFSTQRMVERYLAVYAPAQKKPEARRRPG